MGSTLPTTQRLGTPYAGDGCQHLRVLAAGGPLLSDALRSACSPAVNSFYLHTTLRLHTSLVVASWWNKRLCTPVGARCPRVLDTGSLGSRHTLRAPRTGCPAAPASLCYDVVLLLRIPCVFRVWSTCTICHLDTSLSPLWRPMIQPELSCGVPTHKHMPVPLYPAFQP